MLDRLWESQSELMPPGMFIRPIRQLHPFRDTKVFRTLQRRAIKGNNFEKPGFSVFLKLIKKFSGIYTVRLKLFKISTT